MIDSPYNEPIIKRVGKVGFVCSCFDLLHAGHCLMFKDCKKQCEWLIAGLQIDPTIDRPEKNKPIQSLEERRIQLESIKYVDQIEVYDTESDLVRLIEAINPDVRILGSDYTNKSFTGDHLDIPIYYHDRNHDWSTSELRERIIQA
tara:strand:+ start:394 stop:831 length:438 start_codon:yes stop_codon:yes gene_type:complete